MGTEEERPEEGGRDVLPVRKLQGIHGTEGIDTRGFDTCVQNLQDDPEPSVPPTQVKKVSWVGAPAVWALELACKQLNSAFGGDHDGCCYLVGSALERENWRDVDVRFIMEDKAFATLFPDAVLHSGAWEFDERWLLLVSMISYRLHILTGLKIDFQFQPRTHANERYKGRPRHALGLKMMSRRYEDQQEKVDE